MLPHQIRHSHFFREFQSRSRITIQDRLNYNEYNYVLLLLCLLYIVLIFKMSVVGTENKAECDIRSEHIKW